MCRLTERTLAPAQAPESPARRAKLARPTSRIISTDLHGTVVRGWTTRLRADVSTEERRRS